VALAAAGAFTWVGMVLAGDDTGGRCHAHIADIGLEIAKVAGLVVLGVAAS
jgi:hypothetical protein